MKKGYRVFTVFFVVAVLVMTGGSAMAAWTTTPAGISVIAGANTSLLFNATPQVNPIYSVSGAESMAVGDFVTLKLTGGAVFTGVSTADGLATPGGIATAGALTLMTGSGVAGSTEAKFRASVIIATPSAIRFNLAALINVTGVGVGSNVDFLLSITTSAGTAITTDASIKAATGGAYPFTGVNLMTITNTVNGAAVLDVLSVPAYSKFLNSSLVGGASVLTLTAPTGGFGAATLPNVGLSAKKCLITLAGEFAGITKITNTGFTGSDSAGNTAGGTAGQFLIDSTKKFAYAVNSDAFTATVIVAPNFNIEGGTTVQSARTFTAKVETFVDLGNYLANTFQNPITNYVMTRNGTFFSANSLGPLNNIKISDLSGNVPAGGAKVLISAWDAAGTKLAEASGNADILLQNHGTASISGSEFAARFVGTPLKYEVAIQSTAATLSNIKKDPVTGGITSTVYVPANTGGGAL